MRRPLRLTVINVYAMNRRKPDLRREVFYDADPHLVSASEAHTLGKVEGYRRLSGRGRRGGEVAIYVRNDLDLIWWRVRKVTREGRGYVHERHVVEAVVRHAGVEWAIIAFHANPGHRGQARRQNVRLLRYVAKRSAIHAAADRRVVTPADFNRGAHDDGPDTPRGLARKVGHEVDMHGIDGITHDPHVEVVRSRPFRVPGSNHLGIRYRLRSRDAGTYTAQMEDR